MTNDSLSLAESQILSILSLQDKKINSVLDQLRYARGEIYDEYTVSTQLWNDAKKEFFFRYKIAIISLTVGVFSGAILGQVLSSIIG